MDLTFNNIYLQEPNRMSEGEFTKLSSSTIALICQLGYVFGFTIFSIQAFGTAS